MQTEVLDKFRDLESKYLKLTDTIHQTQVITAETRKEVESIQQSITDLKDDISAMVAEQTTQTWKLITHAFKLIVVLCAVISAYAGIKLLPEIFNLL